MAQPGRGEPLPILSSVPSPAQMLCLRSPNTCPSPSVEVGAIVSLHDERKLGEVTRDARPPQGPYERGPGREGDSTVSSHCSTATGEPSGICQNLRVPVCRWERVPCAYVRVCNPRPQAAGTGPGSPQCVEAALSAHQTKAASWRRLQQGSHRGTGGGPGAPAPGSVRCVHEEGSPKRRRDLARRAGRRDLSHLFLSFLRTCPG